MLVGHFAVALVSKCIEPKTSLGTFVLASMLPDVLWTIFSIAGIEYVADKNRASTFTPHDVAMTHSLLMVAIWAAIFAGFCFLLWLYKYKKPSLRAACILFLVVLSHWLLDSISHRHVLAPGIEKYFGLNLWNSIPATILLEGGFWLIAIVIFNHVTYPKNRAGVYVFWLIVAFLSFVWITNIRTGPPPPETILGSLVFFLLLVAWGYWVNHVRVLRT